MTFQNPWAFLLLFIIPLIIYLKIKKGKDKGTLFSSVPSEFLVPPTLKQRLSSLPYFLKILALFFLILAFARPRLGYENKREVSKGIAINMVIDRSSSMGTPIVADGSKNRLDAVKEAFVNFIVGDDNQLDGRPNDLIGLITFGRYGETLAPLTLSHETLVDFTSTIELIKNREEDGTSIGEAIALASARLEENKNTANSSYTIESSIIILLTDGQNNGGSITPIDAAHLAKKWDIKIYTIAFGGGYYRNAFGMVQKINNNFGIDENTLKEVATITNGKYFSADSKDSLTSIYNAIDELERSEFDSITFGNYKEKFTTFAFISLILLLVSLIMGSTWLRRVP